MRILLVEDNERVVSVVSASLGDAGHAIVAARSCEKARAVLDRERFDLMILDVGLPDGSGLGLCREIRDGGHTAPILVLTAQNGVDDRVAGLDAGADDYLGKPFSSVELCARVRALGRRGPRWTESKRAFGTLEIDRDRRLVTRAGEKVPLTPREFDLVAVLAWAEGRVISRDDLLETVWGEATPSAAASLEVLLTRVRRKLSIEGSEVIRTIRNVGVSWAAARSKKTLGRGCWRTSVSR